MTDTAPLRVLRRPEVRSRTGLSDTRLDELEALGRFPRRVQLSARAVAWVEQEVEDFLRSLIAARDEQQQPKYIPSAGGSTPCVRGPSKSHCVGRD